MPKLIQLVGQHMEVQTHEGQDDEGNTVKLWMFVFTDQVTHDQHRISFDEQARDDMIRQLRGAPSIVRAMAIPKGT